MLKLILLSAVLVAPFSAIAETPWHWQLQDATKVAEDGASLSRVGFKPRSWYPAIVPGTVLTSLVADKVYPEPLYGENNRAIPESLCRTSYWYRTDVPVSRSLRGRRVWLNFEGICYNAEVWVNGSQVGTIRGAFTRGDFDITQLVVPGKTMGLAVKILPPPHPHVPHEHTMALGTGRNGGAMGADGPAMLATVGWDWIPAIRDRDMGIWQKVSLSDTGPVALKDPYVACDLPLPKTDSAKLGVSVDVLNAVDAPEDGVLEGEIGGTSLKFSVPVALASRERKTVRLPDLLMDHPMLWWPNGFGDQHLYNLNLRFVQGGRLSANLATEFGVRTIQYFRPGEKTMTLIVNGVPVFAKGGNWGMDEAMKRIPRERLEALVKLHHDANVTMIRNWIGMSTEEDFYAMCDKYGILIWDDFWIANPVDGPDPIDANLFLANAREKILRYRNHPSVAVWCGRNEGFPPKPIDEGLAQLVQELDGKRFYQPHSAATNGVGGGGPYAYRPPASYFNNVKDSLHTEMGAPSIPTLESIQAMMPKKDWWPINDDWAEHDFCKGAQGGDRFPTEIGDRFGPVTGLADFVRKGHLATYESYRAMFEGREASLWNPATGILLWMSNPCQPSFVWQLYSYDLEQTAAFYATKKACEPIHIELDPRDGRVLVVNNTPSLLLGYSFKTMVYGVDGKGSNFSGSLDVGASSVKAAQTLQLPSSFCLVKLALMDPQGREVSNNFYWLGTDCTAMDKIGMVGLDVSASRSGDKGRDAHFEVVLRNPSEKVAVMAHLQMRKDSGERVLPCFYSDNFVSLLPGESRTVTVTVDKSSIGKGTPYFVMDGWNVQVRPGSSRGAVRVMTNTDAIPAPVR